MNADLKEEEAFHNPIDQLWKLIDNQQLCLEQVSWSFKSHNKLDGTHEKKPHSGGSVQQNQLQDLQFKPRYSSIRRQVGQTHCIFY